MGVCRLASPLRRIFGLRSYATDPIVFGGDSGCDHLWPERQLRGGSKQAQGKTSQRVGRTNIVAQSRQKDLLSGTCLKCGAWIGDLGNEDHPDDYIRHLVLIFRELRRVLCDDGVFWLNIGDSFARSGGWADNNGLDGVKRGETNRAVTYNNKRPDGYKEKDLMMIPAQVAIALRQDGWYLRSEICWFKKNPMPESVTDRPTRSHEMIYLLSKSQTYFYDWEAIKEPSAEPERKRHDRVGGATGDLVRHSVGGLIEGSDWRNKRDVWTTNVAQSEDKGKTDRHFAVFPPELITPMILAGSRPGDTVLDPFLGSGTTAKVAKDLGRQAIGIELSPAYVEIAKRRLMQDVLPLWA